ncbi:MAG: hypothetical protein CL920_14950 [Deltaproteobacteria bacterium]|nr:hypothetical protein [Deltaproteobacteria bacterium]
MKCLHKTYQIALKAGKKVSFYEHYFGIIPATRQLDKEQRGHIIFFFFFAEGIVLYGLICPFLFAMQCCLLC